MFITCHECVRFNHLISLRFGKMGVGGLILLNKVQVGGRSSILATDDDVMIYMLD